GGRGRQRLRRTGLTGDGQVTGGVDTAAVVVGGAPALAAVRRPGQAQAVELAAAGVAQLARFAVEGEGPALAFEHSALVRLPLDQRLAGERPREDEARPLALVVGVGGDRAQHVAGAVRAALLVPGDVGAGEQPFAALLDQARRPHPLAVVEAEGAMAG